MYMKAKSTISCSLEETGTSDGSGGLHTRMTYTSLRPSGMSAKPMLP